MTPEQRAAHARLASLPRQVHQHMVPDKAEVRSAAAVRSAEVRTVRELQKPLQAKVVERLRKRGGELSHLDIAHIFNVRPTKVRARLQPSVNAGRLVERWSGNLTYYRIKE